MKTLEELNAEIDAAEELIKDLRYQVNSHPDTIDKYLGEFKKYPVCKDVINQIEYIDHWDFDQQYHFKFKNNDLIHYFLYDNSSYSCRNSDNYWDWKLKDIDKDLFYLYDDSTPDRLVGHIKDLEPRLMVSYMLKWTGKH